MFNGMRQEWPRGARRASLVRLLALAALLATLSAPALHGRFSPAPEASHSGAADTPAGSAGPLLVPGQTGSAHHNPATCPECAAIAQARTLLPKRAGSAPLILAGRGSIRAPRSPEEPTAAPVASVAHPRAPPYRSLAS